MFERKRRFFYFGNQMTCPTFVRQKITWSNVTGNGTTVYKYRMVGKRYEPCSLKVFSIYETVGCNQLALYKTTTQRRISTWCHHKQSLLILFNRQSFKSYLDVLFSSYSKERRDIQEQHLIREALTGAE